jgi:predicted nucleotidyltransferase
MNIEISKDKIADFCRRWKIVEFSLFGSVLRQDFRSDSDVDVLVKFSAAAEWSLLDHIAMEEELSAMFGRKVDMVSRSAIERSENYIRRQAILETAQPYYVTR